MVLCCFLLTSRFCLFLLYPGSFLSPLDPWFGLVNVLNSRKFTDILTWNMYFSSLFSNFINTVLLILSHSIRYFILYSLFSLYISIWGVSIDLSSVLLILPSPLLSPDCLLKQFSSFPCFWFLWCPFDSFLVFPSLCLITCLCTCSNFQLNALKINLKFSGISSIYPMDVLMILLCLQTPHLAYFVILFV